LLPKNDLENYLGSCNWQKNSSRCKDLLKVTVKFIRERNKDGGVGMRVGREKHCLFPT
jgi:hypothetical protein